MPLRLGGGIRHPGQLNPAYRTYELEYALNKVGCKALITDYGLSAGELGKDVPPDPHSTPLTKREIEAVVDYILATLVGK